MPGYNHRDFPPARARCAGCDQPIHEDGRARTGWMHDTTDSLHCDRARLERAVS